MFYVNTKTFTMGDKLSFQDLDGHELAYIRQLVLSWGPTFEIYRNENLFAIIKKAMFTFFHYRFSVDAPTPGQNILGIEGDFSGMEFDFVHGKRIVARVSRSWPLQKDLYHVEIAGGEDDILILACTIAVDMVCHGTK